MTITPTPQKFLRSPQERLEDAALLSGAGRYMDDLPVHAGTLYAAVVRSPYAHAEVKSIDTAKALQLPGVRGVLTRADACAWSAPFVVGVKSPMEYWCLAMDRARYVGEPVAVVIAESRALAEDGAELVEVDYQPLPVTTDAQQALQSDAPVLHAAVGSNCISERNFVYGEPAEMFAKAAKVVSIDIRYPRNSCTPIECGGVIAHWRAHEEAYDVISNFMGPFSLHTVMALALKVPGSKLRHRYPPDSGGSFGVKQSVLSYVVLMCLASRKVGAPVKWIEDRLEHLTAATSSTARVTTLKAAIDSQGKILALDYDQIDECGAYLRAPEPATFYRMHGCLTGAYDIPHLRVRNRVVLVNKTPSGLVRGFGGPQIYFALERLIQKIAVGCGVSATEIASRNYVRKEQFPYTAAAGAVLDSGDYPGVLSLLQGSPAFQELLNRQERARREGKLYGIGFASVVEPSVSNMGYITAALTPEQRQRAGPKNGAIAAATIAIDPTGAITVIIASAPAGQGHKTVVAQVVADVFGVDLSDVTVNVDLDTQKDAWSVAAGNYSSRFAGAVAGTVHLAALQLRARIAAYAASLLGCAAEQVIFANRAIHASKHSDKRLPLNRVCGAFHWSPALITAALGEDAEVALRATVFWSHEVLAAPDGNDRVNTSLAYGFVLDACGVEIDPLTCAVRIDRYITAHDAGVILHPQGADGQIYGGFSQGVGAATLEEFIYGEDGSFLSGTFADYRIPTAHEIPVPVILHHETPSPFTPLGAKGIGEGNNMSTPVCIANAIADALGVDDVLLPATPPRVYAMLVEKGLVPAVSSHPQDRFSAATSAALRQPSPLRASGSVRLPAKPEAIFAVLLDPQRLRHVIPGCESITCTQSGPDWREYTCVAAVRIGVARARFSAVLSLTEIKQLSSLVLSGEGKGPLGAVSGGGRVCLQVDGSHGTTLTYDYGVNVSGKLAAVGARLLEGATRLVLDQLFKSLGREAAGTVPESLFTRLRNWMRGRR